MTKRSPKTQWQSGDLVLLEAEPKIHARLMRIVDISGTRAKLAPLDLSTLLSNPNGSTGGIWAPLDALVDPALFIKTEEFLETLRDHMHRTETQSE